VDACLGDLQRADDSTEAGDAVEKWLPFLMQISDPLFPTGAYAHSLGFEESVRLGLIRDEASLRTFLLDQVVPLQRTLELPYLRFALNAAKAGDLDALMSLDHEISAWKLVRETRDASVQLGRRRVSSLRVICTDSLLEGWAERIEQGRAAGHYLISCGLQAAVENVPLVAALIGHFYQALSSMCAAALKLLRIGPDRCQFTLRHAVRLAPRVVEASLHLERARAGCFDPLLEIASMRHERANERLFIS